MATIKKKEKREAVLYVHVRPSIKSDLKKEYKKMGYSTLSEYVDELLEKRKVSKNDK